MSWYHTDQFHWDPKDRTFTQKASSLSLPLFRQIYQDACDLGITLVSARTGHPATFYVTGNDLDAHGELVGWTLLPTTQTPRESPELVGVKVIIFND